MEGDGWLDREFESVPSADFAFGVLGNEVDVDDSLDGVPCDGEIFGFEGLFVDYIRELAIFDWFGEGFRDFGERLWVVGEVRMLGVDLI